MLTGGCGPWLERPLGDVRDRVAGGLERVALLPYGRPVACGAGPYPSRDRGPRRLDAFIGPLRFRGVNFPYPPESFGGGAPPLGIPVVVPARTDAIISVPAGLRREVGLDGDPVPPERPSEAHRAVRCTTTVEPQVFTVQFVLSGPRCVPVTVTAAGRSETREVPFGVADCDG